MNELSMWLSVWSRYCEWLVYVVVMDMEIG